MITAGPAIFLLGEKDDVEDVLHVDSPLG
ncbi:MAG: hypothetical protein LZF60_340129 [Nitrospira sp.]|nr:MAG: hypothetical protein LZF60_340129 [Nitrospira sp.]